MPVYNAGDYLDESIPSILEQDYNNFEFIIIDDGSTDNSKEIILKWGDLDSRIKYFYKHNSGISDSLNLGISKAKGYFIARMDADDICLPNRFSTQIKYMLNNKIDVCGSSIYEFGIYNKLRIFPETHDEIATNLFLFGRTLAHPTIIFKTKVFNTFRYSNKYSKYAQDFLILMDILTKSKYKFGNCQIPLLKYRIHETQIRNKEGDHSLDVVEKIISNTLKSFHVNISDEEIIINSKINRKINGITYLDIITYWEFLSKLKRIFRIKELPVYYIYKNFMSIIYKKIISDLVLFKYFFKRACQAKISKNMNKISFIYNTKNS